MESLTDYGYSCMNNGTNVRHCLQCIKSTELEVAVNVFQAQPEKYGTEFDVNVSYVGKMVTKKSLHIAKTGSQPMRLKMADFLGKLDCKKKLKAIWNSMTEEQ